MTAGRPRVLHVIEDLGLGGAERLLTTLLPALARCGVASEVAVLGSRRDLAPALEAAGIAVHQAGLPSLRRPVGAVRWLGRVVDAVRPDLIHTHLAFANLYGRAAAWRAGIPATTTYHDADYEPEVLRAHPGLRAWKQAAYRLADRASARVTPTVIAVSDYVASSLRRRLRFPPDAVDVIRNGVPPSAWREIDAAERARARAAIGATADTFVILQVGRLSPQKGQTDTVEAAARLRHVPDLRWILVGDGPSRPALESGIASAGLSSVTLAGGHADVQPFLAAADLFVFPSLHEGLGIAVLEAMGAGLPVVAYRTGPLPEVVVDGETGILVDAGDVAALAGAIEILHGARDRGRAMGTSGRARVAEHFDIAGTAERHARLYRRLLERGPVGPR